VVRRESSELRVLSPAKTKANKAETKANKAEKENPQFYSQMNLRSLSTE
jgi:hypothetical protein